MTTSSEGRCQRLAWLDAAHNVFWWVHTDPFGRPVVPEVYISITSPEPSGRGTGGSSVEAESTSGRSAQSGAGTSPSARQNQRRTASDSRIGSRVAPRAGGGENT